MIQIDELLPNVQKPARYTGGELGETVKAARGLTRFAFCFPDVYEVGMSHLGMKILYHALNERDDTVCERVFAPWVDMEAAMQDAGLPLFSLETRTPLGEFDIIGFTLQYEMSYSNVLNMLRLAGLPLRAAMRGEDAPLVVAGGPCAFNPEPLADFMDLFIVGDGEESTQRLCELYSKMRGQSKTEFLLRVANEIPGAYVPSFYNPQYGSGGNFLDIHPIRNDVPDRIVRAFVTDLDSQPYPEHIIVPNTEIVHDRIMLEIARGCTRGCRFCQAGMIYRPKRERSLGKLLNLADELICSTGYEEISLSSLSTGDYSELGELAAGLMRAHAKDRVAVALPSLRVDSQLEETLGEIDKVRKSSLTFAPEAGTQRLRDVINKGITQEQMLSQAREAFSAGYHSIKLYFMIGLPTETMEDIDGIVELTRAVAGEYYGLSKDKRSPKGLRLSVSASSFVPKPDTPFQWCAQDAYEKLVEKQKYLRERLRRVRDAQFNYHDPKLSVLEAAFARGDRRLGAVLERAVELGCSFDGWSEQFKYDTWMKAFEDMSLSAEMFACREVRLDEALPWEHIDCGVSREYLKAEYRNALNGQVTPDCREGCLGCGINLVIKEGCPCAL